MIMLKQKVKFLIVMLLCATCFMCGCGANNFDGINIFHNGKGEANILISSDKSEEEFSQSVDDFVAGVRLISGYSDIVKVNQITKADGGYNVFVKFRRIDKVKINGMIERKNVCDYVREGSQELELLKQLSKSNISCSMQAYYNEKLGKIKVSRKERYKVAPKNIDGKELEFENFISECSGLGKRHKIMLFRMFDIENIKSIKVKLPGNIKYVGGDNIKITAQDEIEINSVDIKATLIKNVIKKNENGDEIIDTETEVKKVNSFVGYFIYESSLSPFEITMIVIGSIIGCAIIVAILSYFYITGKREIERRDSQK